MSNLPITTSTPQTAAKPAQAATTPPEDSAAQGQPFGDVLARQVSDAAAAEGTPIPKKSAKPTGDILDKIKRDDDTTPALTADTTTNLPTDMLAALIPQGIAIAAQPTTAAATGVPSQAAATADATGLPAQAATAAAMTGTGLPVQAAVAEDATGLSKQTALPPTLAKTDLGASQGTPAPISKGAGITRDALVESKKDAAFTSMLATMNATMANKPLHADEKASAVPQPNAAALASMQASATPLAPAIVLPAVVAINTPVTHDNWGDEFNQKITWLANAKEQSAELHLNPPQLGPMDVVLKINGDQATALFTSPHAAVRDAIEQALPKLREMLAESGIMLGNASVGDHASRNRQDESGNKSSNPRSGLSGIAGPGAASNLTMRVAPINRHNGIVDTFA